jgi:hypothetical protein
MQASIGCLLVPITMEVNYAVLRIGKKARWLNDYTEVVNGKLDQFQDRFSTLISRSLTLVAGINRDGKKFSPRTTTTYRRAQEISDELDACAQRLNDLIVMLQAVYPQVATLLGNPPSAGSPTTRGSAGS